MKMSHQSCKSFPHKHNLPKTSNDHHSIKSKSSCHAASVVHNCKPACSSSMNTDVHCNSSHKVRRLKTRKERNQVRDQERNRSQTHHQHSKIVGGEKPQCHHIHPLSCSRKESTFAKPFIPQKPSIITEGRLTSIRGLFSHEVRSIDIERLVSEQIKTDKQKKDQRKMSTTHITSPLSPLVTLPDSDQDCTLDEVQEPHQEQENNMLPHVKKKKCSKKELTGKNGGIQTNRGVAGPMELSREDGKYDRNANSRKEDTNSKTNSSSPRETENMVLSSLENETVHHLCSTPVETNKNNSHILQTDILKSRDEGNQDNGSMNIQRFEKTPTMIEFPNMEVPQMLENPQTLTSLSELDSGAGQLADIVKQRTQMSMSCREAVKRLATRLCQASELHVPSHRRPLLSECREALMHTLQKRHSFQLENNLHRLHSFLNGKQTASRLSSGQRHEDCLSFSHAVENENRSYSRNMEIWTDSAMQHDYLAEEVRLDLERGDSTRKRRIQEWNTSFPPFSLEEPRQSHTDMSLQFDQWRADKLSQDCFRAQHHPSRHLFNQSQTFTQHAVPMHTAPTWLDHPVNFYSQQQSLSTGESLESVNLDLSRISQQCTEETDLNFNSQHIYESRKQKPQEPPFEGSRFWSHQQKGRDERENCAPFSFSASYLSEGFQYEPFFRCPRPSNTQRRSNCLSMTHCPTSTKPFYPPLGLYL
ncbi:uncharacterized protein [Pseudorasbora parva]|uniref:uncharacterized protein n=1 Tax=Pseudorasbora parva TaxID=51549 RepID=UPI00351E7A3C